MNIAKPESIFISYRRSASQYFVRALYAELVGRGFDVFFDIERMTPGEYRKTINNQIMARQYFFPVLAPGTVERFENKNDILREEIELAIKNGRNIIPIVHGNFSFDQFSDYFKGELALLPKLQALNVHDEYFFEAVDRLVNQYIGKTFRGELRKTSEFEREMILRRQEFLKTHPLPALTELEAEKAFNLAEGYVRDKEYFKAIEFSTESVFLKPNFAEAYFQRGKAYQGLKEYADAIDNYTQAIDLYPEAGRFYSYRGVCFVSMNNHAAAAEDFQQAIENSEHNSQAYVRLGKAQFENREYAMALSAFEEALRIDNSFISALNGIGSVYYRLKMYDKAVGFYDEALIIDPSYKQAERNKEKAQSKLGEQ